MRARNDQIIDWVMDHFNLVTHTTDHNDQNYIELMDRITGDLSLATNLMGIERRIMELGEVLPRSLTATTDLIFTKAKRRLRLLEIMASNEREAGE